jgi:hypothetical protein
MKTLQMMFILVDCAMNLLSPQLKYMDQLFENAEGLQANRSPVRANEALS